MGKGMLVTFSGLDGAGKSTQIELLLEALRRQGYHPIYLWTRGGYTTLFEALKRVLRKAPAQVIPPSGPNPKRSAAFSRPFVRRIWLVLALIDLIRVYGLQVRMWRWRGYAVICDRYLWDTLIDFKLNLPSEQVERWWLWRALVRLAPRPHAAFLLLVPVEESLRRSDIKGEPFRDSAEVLERRLAAYQQLSKDIRWHVLDGRQAKSELAAEIIGTIKLTGGLEQDSMRTAQELGAQD
jgi:dTMP kinase